MQRVMRRYLIPILHDIIEFILVCGETKVSLSVVNMSFFKNFEAEDESVDTSGKESDDNNPSMVVSDEDNSEPSQPLHTEISVLGELQNIKVALDDLGKQLGKLEKKMDAKQGVCNSSSTMTTPKCHRSKAVPAQVRVS